MQSNFSEYANMLRMQGYKSGLRHGLLMGAACGFALGLIAAKFIIWLA